MPEILIIGASGLAGTAALKHFAAKPGWKTTAVSRRRPLGEAIAQIRTKEELGGRLGRHAGSILV